MKFSKRVTRKLSNIFYYILAPHAFSLKAFQFLFLGYSYSSFIFKRRSSDFLSYHILLLDKLFDNKIALVDFYINSFHHTQTPPPKLDETIAIIRREKGDFFADRLIQQFSFPTKRLRHRAYEFPVGLKTIEEYCIESGSKLTKLAPARKFTFSHPEIFEDPEIFPTRELEIPESWIAEISKAELVAGFCVYKNQNIIIYEKAAYPHPEWQVSGTSQFLRPVKNATARAHYLFSSKKKFKHSEGILLSGRCSTNYYHWLIEYLPKLFEINSQPHLAEVPLIVDSRMPIQHFQALEILVGKNRKLIRYNNEDILEFNKLYIPSVASYLPDRFDLPMWGLAVMSKEHLIYIRDRLIEEVLKTTAPAKHYHERIYLSRTQKQGRKISNAQDMEALFIKKGFHEVYLQELTFPEQVLTIRNAKVIAGPGGAAFANLLFCTKATTVISITGERNKESCNFSNVGQINDINFIYLTGPSTMPREKFKSDEEHAHSSFTISIEKLSRMLENLGL